MHLFQIILKVVVLMMTIMIFKTWEVNTWVKIDKSTLGPCTRNPGVKHIPSDLTNISEVFFEDYLFLNIG